MLLLLKPWRQAGPHELLRFFDGPLLGDFMGDATMLKPMYPL